MAEAKPVTIRAPWKGLCFIDSLETPQHDVCAINVDYAYGAKKPRRGWTSLGENAPSYPAMFQHVFGASQRYILMVGLIGTYSDNSPADVIVRIANQWGQPGFGNSWTASTFNLTTLYGEPRSNTFVLCDAAPGMISTAEGGTRTVTVLTTQYQSYIFDPLEVPAYLVRQMSSAQVSTGGDALQLAGGSFPYFETAPHGYILERHQEAYWYGGWKAGDEVVLAQPNPASGTPSSLTSVVQNTTRTTQAMGPWIVAYSDPSDPAGVLGWHIFGVDGYEQITGLQSQNQSLVIFTQTSTYLLQGNDDSSFTKQTLSRGIGCASHQSIIDADGLTYWLAYDGAYMLNPGDGVTCISELIKPLWTGQYNATVESPNFPVEENGWPYVISRGLLQYAKGVYHRPSRCLWWFVPVKPYTTPVGGYATVDTIQIVYYLDSKSWSIWLGPGAAVGLDPAQSQQMCGATVIETANGTKTYAVDTVGNFYLYGMSQTDPGELGPAVYWMSGRVFLPSDVWALWRRIQFKVLSRGTSDFANPVGILRGERYAIDPDGTSPGKCESAITFVPITGDVYANCWGNGGTNQDWGPGGANVSLWAASDWITVACDTGLQEESPSVRIGLVDKGTLVTCVAYTCELVAPLNNRARTQFT